MRACLRVLAPLLCLAAAGTLAHAQSGQPASPTQNLLTALRTHRLMPLSTPPAIDWPRIKNAYAFADAHRKSINTTLATTSLVSTYACRDIEPVLVYTGRLLNDYNNRIKETGDWVNEILATPKDKNEFLHKNYKRAVDLGLYHLDVAGQVKIKELGWNPQVRTPMNQDAFSFVLYSFAWQPIEAMLASQEIDAQKDSKAIEDYLYLWHVLGYGMGVDARLLPQDAQQTQALVALLRKNQYLGPAETRPREMRTLVKNEMKYLYWVTGKGRPIDDPTKLQVRQMLAQQIAYSPGLSQALGLGDDPAKGLEDLADSTID